MLTTFDSGRWLGLVGFVLRRLLLHLLRRRQLLHCSGGSSSGGTLSRCLPFGWRIAEENSSQSNTVCWFEIMSKNG